MTYFDIEDVKTIQKIFQEYVEFTMPLVQIAEEKTQNIGKG